MKEFNDILKEIGSDRKQLAKEIGMQYTSLTNQLAKSKPLPKWAKSMVYLYKALKKQ